MATSNRQLFEEVELRGGQNAFNRNKCKLICDAESNPSKKAALRGEETGVFGVEMGLNLETFLECDASNNSSVCWVKPSRGMLHLHCFQARIFDFQAL